NIEETELVVEEMLEQYPNGKNVRLLFHGEQAKLPIISHIVQENQVEVSIIQGNIQQTKQGAVGSLYIKIFCEDQKIKPGIVGLSK
ncbi:NIL domain-containing protein, partial [Enterococcus faecalis]|uniref:NIL domain-containing protein n=1 Tax=Enterococcus faecalis TaxID=1351 RepID=UPI003CC6AC27